MRIAIVGCGQLSRMMAIAGIPLGLQFSFVKDNIGQSNECVEGLGLIQESPEKGGEGYNKQAIEKLYNDLGKPDCVTVEKEQVDLDLLIALTDFCPVYPGIEAVKACQHRGEEKQLLANLSIPTSPYFYNTKAVEAVAELGFPVMVKSCTEGYDGKNQWLLKTKQDAEEFDALNVQDYIIEAFVAFDKEISQVSVRSKSGEIKHYALADNHHEKGILIGSITPAVNISEKLIGKAQRHMESLLTELNYVGVLAMECFVLGDDLMVNELAPRVHNSGHWTQLGSITCQFENHVRAILGISLGSTSQVSPTAMLNLIGTELPSFDVLDENSTLYWYNKTVRDNRKLGHINFVANTHEELYQKMSELGDKVSSK
jgi:5-(carboxyamino)imidazole ribonucleotide synthase